MTRLNAPFGTRINQDNTLRFTFEGRTFEGFEGDTIASALAANNQWMLSRSFKYHRPRGVMSMAGAEANTLVQVAGEPNVPADLTPLKDGMVITAQNVNGNLARDRDAIMDKFGRFMPVGFYYRTFMGPTKSAWLKIWEPLIRKKAGLGIIDTATPRQHFDQQTLHCDIAVIGGGPAGIIAAVEAARSGADVVLIDDQPELGGSLSYAPQTDVDHQALGDMAQNEAGLRILTSTICNGLFEDNWLSLIQGHQLIRARAAQVILATGSIEQPAVFRGNDLPGILLGSAAQRLMHHYGVRPGGKAVVLAANPQGYSVAHDLVAAGVDVVAIADPRKDGHGVPPTGVPILQGMIQEAGGCAHISKVKIRDEWITCDLLVVSVGQTPAWQLPCQAGASLGYDEA
jgi:sarcosine oxidase subunit alpha